MREYVCGCVCVCVCLGGGQYKGHLYICGNHRWSEGGWGGGGNHSKWPSRTICSVTPIAHVQNINNTYIYTCFDLSLGGTMHIYADM